jgi:hypothetical protein
MLLYDALLGGLHQSRHILSSRRGQSKGLRTDATGMPVIPGMIAKHFNVIEDIRPDHLPNFVYSLPDAFFFT